MSRRTQTAAHNTLKLERTHTRTPSEGGASPSSAIAPFVWEGPSASSLASPPRFYNGRSVAYAHEPPRHKNHSVSGSEREEGVETTAPGAGDLTMDVGSALRRGGRPGSNVARKWRLSALALLIWCVQTACALPPWGVRVFATGLQARAGLSAATMRVGFKRFGQSLSSSGKRVLVRLPLCVLCIEVGLDSSKGDSRRGVPDQGVL